MPLPSLQAAVHLDQAQLAAQAAHEQQELSAARQVEALNLQLAELRQQLADALASSATAAEQRALDVLAADERLAAMLQQHEGLQERTASLQQQLDAAAVIHSRDLLQLQRLHSEVADAELLLAPFSECCSVSSASAGTPMAASSSQLCHSIRMVVDQLRDLQHLEKSLAAEAAKGGSIVPLLTPMHSDASCSGGRLIAAVHGPSTSSAAVPATLQVEEAAKGVYMIRSYPVQVCVIEALRPPGGLLV